MAKTPEGNQTVPVYGTDGEPLFYTTPEGYQDYVSKMATTPQGTEFLTGIHSGGTTTGGASSGISDWLYDEANWDDPNYDTILASNQVRWGDESFQDPRTWMGGQQVPEFTGLVAGPGYDELTGAPYVMEGGERNYQDETIVDTPIGRSFGGQKLSPKDAGGTPPPAPPPPTGGTAPQVPNTRPNLPPPEGGPIEPWLIPTLRGETQDTSWNWDYFAPKQQGDGAWGGYDTDYQAFERYQPGMDSPWGMPDVMGGNEAFYQQQFVNLLRDEQGFRNRQRQADAQRQLAANRTPERPEMDWSWAFGGEGLPEVTGGIPSSANLPEANEYGYILNPAYNLERGMTNQQAVSQLGNLLNPDELALMSKHFERNPDAASNTMWLRHGSPSNALADIGQVDDGFGSVLNKLYQNIYVKPGDVAIPGQPTVPTGYASPVSGG